MYAAIYFAYISCAVAALLTLEKEKAINSLLEERGSYLPSANEFIFRTEGTEDAEVNCLLQVSFVSRTEASGLGHGGILLGSVSIRFYPFNPRHIVYLRNAECISVSQKWQFAADFIQRCF